MAITQIGQTSGGSATTSITLTYPAGIQAGDYIILLAWKASLTAPALSTGYTSIGTQSANANSFRIQYKVATGSESGATIATSSNVAQMSIYRGVKQIGGSGSGTNASSTTTTVPGIATMTNTSGTSWVVTYAASKQSSSQSTPSGTTLRGIVDGSAGAGGLALISDTNGGVSSWAQHTSTAGIAATGGGGSVELVASVPMEQFVDPFNTTSLNTTLWTQTALGGATFTYTTAGANIIYPASTTTSTDGDLISVNSYDLTGSYAYMKVLSVASGVATTDNFLRLGTAANCLRWLYEGGNIYAQQFVGGTQTNLFNVAYSSTTHAYWRIREASGTTYWETSPDGSTWTVQFSKANPISVLSLSVCIAGTAFNTSSSPGTFSFIGFNTMTSTPNNMSGLFFQMF